MERPAGCGLVIRAAEATGPGRDLRVRLPADRLPRRVVRLTDVSRRELDTAGGPAFEVDAAGEVHAGFDRPAAGRVPGLRRHG